MDDAFSQLPAFGEKRPNTSLLTIINLPWYSKYDRPRRTNISMHYE
jgi:hypothetical protein